jgi:acyl-CoA synthetase (AMP-forming)/AMP-acid ligase II
MTTLDVLVKQAVGAAPDKLALGDAPNRETFFSGNPVRLTWGELDHAIDGVAAALQAAGVSVGDAVAVQLPNAVELPVAILACIRIGAVATPFPIQHREHELRYGLGVSGARHLITAARPDRPDLLDASAGVLAEFDATMFTFGDTHPAASTPLSLDGGGTPRAHTAGPNDNATICWTSGTTGMPKGVPRTHSMWMASSSFQVSELGLGADDRILCPFPVVNMAGIGGMLVPWLATGSSLFLHNPIDLMTFLGQVTNEEITYTVAPPPLLNMLLRNEAMLDGVDMSHVRKISSGSAPLDPWMVEGWQERGIEIVNVFGSNEGAAMLSTAATVPDPALRARNFPVPTREGVEVRLVDSDTNVEITEPSVPGELRFRGVTVFAGYLESDGAEFDDEGYYRTGDIFEIVDAPGPTLLRFVDRAKDIVIRGGMNVSAAEVEALISSHESVAECAVVAFPDPDLGEKVGVFVVAAPEARPTLEEVLAHLRAQSIASYKLPERLEVIDALPRNPVGKIVKGELRDRWASAG